MGVIDVITVVKREMGPVPETWKSSRNTHGIIQARSSDLEFTCASAWCMAITPYQEQLKPWIESREREASCSWEFQDGSWQSKGEGNVGIETPCNGDSWTVGSKLRTTISARIQSRLRSWNQRSNSWESSCRLWVQERQKHWLWALNNRTKCGQQVDL